MSQTIIESKQEQFADVLQNHLRRGGLVELTVGEVMTPRPTTITPDLNAYDLVEMFHAKRFRHLLVSETNGRLVGVISDRDVIRCFGVGQEPTQAFLEGISAAELMSGDLVTIQPSTPLVEAVGMIINYGINCLPVVTGERAVGILTSTDLYLVLEQVLQADFD